MKWALIMLASAVICYLSTEYLPGIYGVVITLFVFVVVSIGALVLYLRKKRADSKGN